MVSPDAWAPPPPPPPPQTDMSAPFSKPELFQQIVGQSVLMCSSILVLIVLALNWNIEWKHFQWQRPGGIWGDWEACWIMLIVDGDVPWRLESLCSTGAERSGVAEREETFATDPTASQPRFSCHDFLPTVLVCSRDHNPSMGECRDSVPLDSSSGEIERGIAHLLLIPHKLPTCGRSHGSSSLFTVHFPGHGAGLRRPQDEICDSAYCLEPMLFISIGFSLCGCSVWFFMGLLERDPWPSIASVGHFGTFFAKSQCLLSFIRLSESLHQHSLPATALAILLFQVCTTRTDTQCLWLWSS